MLELTPPTAAAYLRERGAVRPREPVEVRELAGGVSNTVLLVHRPDSHGGDFVLKQALPRLKVQQEWLCSIERIWREVEVLEICGQLLASGGRWLPETQPPDTISRKTWTTAVPQLLFSDRANYCYAMTAAPAGHQTWKEQLLAGQADAAIAAACGDLLGKLHARTWNNAQVRECFADKQFFFDLRIDPYYRELARVHPELQDRLELLIRGCDGHPRCLTHGDFSPKNLLISPGQIMLIDFEVGHYGDPTFDTGFLTSHLALKAFRARENYRPYLDLIDDFIRAYVSQVQPALESQADKIVRLPDFCGQRPDSVYQEANLLNWLHSHHFLACLLARIDGKSRADYLTEDLREHVRGFVWPMLRDFPPFSFDELMSGLRRELRNRFG